MAAPLLQTRRSDLTHNSLGLNLICAQADYPLDPYRRRKGKEAPFGSIASSLVSGELASVLGRSRGRGEWMEGECRDCCCRCSMHVSIALLPAGLGALLGS